MKMWSGHPSDYGMLRIFGCVVYSQVKQGKLEPRAVKCVLLGYPEGVKGYKLYRLDDESPKIVTSMNVVFNESVIYKDTLKDSGADQEDGDDRDAGDQETDQTPDLTDYQLVRDRELKTRMKPLRFRDESNMADYAFMDSLRKNKTWELVDHPARQKLVSCKWLFMRIKDDMSIACKSKAEIGSTKSLLKKEFDMKELGEAKKILGMEIVRDRMPLGGHFKLLLKDCPFKDCDVERISKVSYANAVVSLMYLMVCTRPDIAYAVSIVSRYLANPDKNHWEAMKWILRYLCGTANVGLVYGTNRGNHVDITCFVDSDYVKDPNKEAEYMALIEAVKETIWLRRLLEELDVELNTVAINCDNQGAIHLSRNHVFYERAKHINVRYHCIIEVLKAMTVKVLKWALNTMLRMP
uniref:Retroviral polymerase SH3-like domain-containing protein n=1 Tax=Tanacetum cinerariifolium TaxID=118510 RepID=A0A699IXA6_TANCI|nr:hypothetical protein [Tanacetum cinerariifolium]